MNLASLRVEIVQTQEGYVVALSSHSEAGQPLGDDMRIAATPDDAATLVRAALFSLRSKTAANSTNP
jgi:hypothetical protein